LKLFSGIVLVFINLVSQGRHQNGGGRQPLLSVEQKVISPLFTSTLGVQAGGVS
jgi:hypothetical protein